MNSIKRATRMAAFLYAIISSGVVAFQIALGIIFPINSSAGRMGVTRICSMVRDHGPVLATVYHFMHLKVLDMVGVFDYYTTNIIYDKSHIGVV